MSLLLQGRKIQMYIGGGVKYTLHLFLQTSMCRTPRKKHNMPDDVSSLDYRVKQKVYSKIISEEEEEEFIYHK